METPRTFNYRIVAPEHRHRPVPRAAPVVACPIDVPAEIRCEEISVVIPVKNNQEGIDGFLTSVARIEPGLRPREIIVVDNNSAQMTELRVDCPVPVTILECKNRGPGAARNVGVAAASGEWILFTDSDCVATPSLVSAYVRDDNGAVGYAGMVETPVIDPFTRFYVEENVFIPFALTTSTGVVPGTLITANCLVLKRAFLAIGGFNEHFVYAGGEDTDLGYRLRMVGRLEYNLRSIAGHSIDDGLSGFMDRFVRYGRGHALLARHYANPGMFDPMTPSRKSPRSAQEVLNEICLFCMRWGYLLEMANVAR